MQTSTTGRHFIEAWEGCILQAYDDFNDRVVRPGQHVKGTLTIGYGHTTAAGAPRVYVGMAIGQDQADRILTADLAGVEVEIEHLVKVPLTPCQFDAVSSFHFNTGWLTHPHCSLLEAINRGDYALADHDFMLYDRAQGRVIEGLVERRKAEMELFATGVYRGPSDVKVA